MRHVVKDYTAGTVFSLAVGGAWILARIEFALPAILLLGLIVVLSK